MSDETPSAPEPVRESSDASTSMLETPSVLEVQPASTPPPVDVSASQVAPEIVPEQIGVLGAEVTNSPTPAEASRVDIAPENSLSEPTPSAMTQSTTSAPLPQTPPSSTTPPSIATYREVALASRRAKKGVRLEKIIALARSKESITNRDVELLLHVSNATATRYLQELSTTGRLIRSGKLRGTTYSLSGAI